MTHRSTPTRSHPGDLVGKYGVQASATDLEALPFGPNPPPGDPALGALLQNRSPRSGSKPPMERPSSSDPSDRSAMKRSVQQSSVNRLVHSEHSTGHRSHRVYRAHRSDRSHRSDQAHRSHHANRAHRSHQSPPVRKLKRYRLTSAWTSLS